MIRRRSILGAALALAFRPALPAPNPEPIYCMAVEWQNRDFLRELYEPDAEDAPYATLPLFRGELGQYDGIRIIRSAPR